MSLPRTNEDMSSMLISRYATNPQPTLSSASDDDVFDDSTTSSPVHGLPFGFHPGHLAQYHQHTSLQQAQSQHVQKQLQQAQQQQQLRLQQCFPAYRTAVGPFAQAAPTATYVPPIAYPIIDPRDAWLSLSQYSQARPQIFDCTFSTWNAALPAFASAQTSSPRSATRRKKSSGSSQQSQAEKKPVVEEVDVTTLFPRDAVMKAKIRLANLLEWKAYTKNNTWTPEIVLNEPFIVPINIKFLQLVPTSHYLVSIGFALREDTPGLMSFSEETLQWNSIEGAVHQAPRKASSHSSASEKFKPEAMLMDVPPANTVKLNNGRAMTGKDLMESPKEFTELTVGQYAEDPNQIVLRPHYKYSPCLYLSLLSDDTEDYTVLFTRKVMIHDIKMVPVEHLHNPMLCSYSSQSPISSSDSLS